LDTLEHSKRETLSGNIIQIRSYASGGLVETSCCKKETQELRRELSDVSKELCSLNKLISVIG